jgi:plasmid stabilization system protein ParE
MYTLIYSNDSQEDIKSLLQFTLETIGENQASIYFDKLEKCLDKITSMPSIGHIRNDLPTETLAYNFESHTIIYQIMKIIN